MTIVPRPPVRRRIRRYVGNGELQVLAARRIVTLPMSEAVWRMSVLREQAEDRNLRHSGLRAVDVMSTRTVSSRSIRARNSSTSAAFECSSPVALKSENRFLRQELERQGEAHMELQRRLEKIETESR